MHCQHESKEPFSGCGCGRLLTNLANTSLEKDMFMADLILLLIPSVNRHLSWVSIGGETYMNLVQVTLEFIQILGIDDTGTQLRIITIKTLDDISIFAHL